MRPICFLLLLPAMVAAQSASLSGVVRSRPGNKGTPNAEVAIPDLGLVGRTDSAGVFRIAEIKPGSHVVVARRLGYDPDTVPLFFAADQAYERDFLLEERPAELSAVEVKARQPVPAKLRDFEERKKKGLGSFWSQEEFDKYRARVLSDFLIHGRGLELRRGGGMSYFVKSTRNSCLALIYLDGVPVYLGRPRERAFDINQISPNQIAAVEWYNGSAEVPVEYARPGSACGVLLIWTR